ncbi:MAG: hypothetical protein GY820_47250 [Gammaproteobacteria bacterium]|nr:hypothetical protein [Gammaproteobacteria bacterium]
MASREQTFVKTSNFAEIIDFAKGERLGEEAALEGGRTRLRGGSGLGGMEAIRREE